MNQLPQKKDKKDKDKAAQKKEDVVFEATHEILSEDFQVFLGDQMYEYNMPYLAEIGGAVRALRSPLFRAPLAWALEPVEKKAKVIKASFVEK